MRLKADAPALKSVAPAAAVPAPVTPTPAKAPAAAPPAIPFGPSGQPTAAPSVKLDNRAGASHVSARISSSGGAPVGGQSFQKAFARVVGPSAVQDLVKAFTSSPVVLIAGDQLTGKSTAAKAVAVALGDGDKVSGTGKLVRQMAADRGRTIEEFSGDLKAMPDTDVELDYQAALKIGKGEVLTFESRLAGHLGDMLEQLGRENVVSVYLTATPRERALRYLQREVSPEARAALESKLPKDDNATLEESLQALVNLAKSDPTTSFIADKLVEVAKSVKDISARDDNDLSRLKSLYGVNYQDRSSFDVVIDTSGKSIDQVQAEILRSVKDALAEKASAG